jgi:hypothetical protein
MLAIGGSTDAAAARITPTDELEKNTTDRRVNTVQKPSKHSFIQTQKPNSVPRRAPTPMKTTHNTQHTIESATVLRIMNIGSFLNRKWLVP